MNTATFFLAPHVPLDITNLLKDWAFSTEDVTARIITGDDGREKVQLRLDLGLLQMEVDGRPDGEVVKGHASWLEYYQSQQREHDSANPDGVPYQLESEDCAELMREGVQYYHRYVCFWQLKRYELCARDTSRNLDLFRFVRSHAKSNHDKVQFDQWRPYVTMMHARAVATPLVELEQWDAAINVIESGISGINEFLTDYGQVEQAEKVGELLFLKRWRKEVKRQAAPDVDQDDEFDPIAKLQEELGVAIGEERYEDAARLRDEISRLENPPPPSGMSGR